MRGNRVRNIVNELHGEKIDIVRYHEDIKEYIKAALSPAKISEIKLDKEKMRAEVIVDNDQLSLAIGKHGQNVRLASRLIGWELDIRAKLAAVVSEVPKEEAIKEGVSLDELSGVGEKTLANLKEGGFNTIEDIAKVKIEELTKIKGIGEKKAQKLIEEAKKLIKK
jgi:N utilization substance protein A